MSHLLSLGLAALLSGGCTGPAEPAAESIAAWQGLSGQAAQVAAAHAAAAGRPVHVQPRDPLMPYSAAVQDLIEADLAALGVTVVPFRSGALVLRHDVEPPAAPVHALYGGGRSAVLLSWELRQGDAILAKGAQPVLVPARELVNYAAWTSAPGFEAPVLDLAALPGRQFAVVGDPGLSEAARRAYQRSLRK